MVKHVDLNRSFAALADPVRRAVLSRLRGGPQPVSALAADHAMSLPAFMKHVTTLERAGLVTSAKVGRVRTCVLCEPGLSAVESWLHAHRAFWVQQLESLERFLGDEDGGENACRSTPRSRSKSGAASPRPPRASTTRGRPRGR